MAPESIAIRSAELAETPVTAANAIDHAPMTSDRGRGISDIETSLDELQSINDALNDDVAQLSETLCDKFEEIRLIHDLTARLELDNDPTEVCQDLLSQLHGCLSCRTLIIQLDPDEDDAAGECLGVGDDVSLDELNDLMAAVVAEDRVPKSSPTEPMIANRGTMPPLQGRRVVVLPIYRRGEQLGRLVAIRSRHDSEFGTVEVDLLRSVLMVLSLHLVSQRQYTAMESMLKGMVRSLASALDAKDAYTHGHSSRVADLATALATRLQMNAESVESLQLAGILHDIGKIGIDDSVLKKPGRLTAEEFDQIKQHPVLGYEILKDIRPFRHILPAVRHHHESWDGNGYPDGLAGEDIPRDAQILAVADAFDAMVSDRPYRRGMPLEKVIKIFQSGRGQQWAADVVDALLSSHDLLDEFTQKHQNLDLNEPSDASAESADIVD